MTANRELLFVLRSGRDSEGLRRIDVYSISDLSYQLSLAVPGATRSIAATADMLVTLETDLVAGLYRYPLDSILRGGLP